MRSACSRVGASVLSELQYNVIQDLLAKVLDVDPSMVTPSTHLRDELCLDSLQQVELQAWLAARGVDLAALPPGGPQTVGDVQALVDAVDAVDAAHDGGQARQAASLPGPASGPAHPVLHSAQLALRPVSPEYVPFLYDLATREEVGWRWRFRGAIPDIETFQAGLRQGALSQFVVVVAPNGEPVGTVSCYNADLHRGIAFLAAAFVPEHVAGGVPMTAVGMFLRYLFQVWDLRKIYMEVPDFNYTQIASGAGKYFEVEGHLREHSYYDGRYWDEYMLAIYRRHVVDPRPRP
ncbi:phosphopantetheine-binding protein [Pseudofrankia inefficax]|uniref:phosphopantetheine-binding protein n=1 Tax=Pseudofrankia inefficax (strain DSM 45817 / CECT 9037 / DDB 130130 / EuI1c) TaxID=298654 RepID=UPI0022B64CA5|nr:phosphopantetheine-binding protein [Pseudofrankia inefficax]